MLAMLTVSVVALIACGAFVMDVGAWLQGHRATQAVADASALAGAQALARDTGMATAIALDYSTKNGGGVAGGDIQFASNTFTADTIQVKARRTGAGFLSRVLGISSVNSHSGCGGARLQPRRGDVRRAVRHRQERAVPLGRRLPLLLRADELRSRTRSAPEASRSSTSTAPRAVIGPGTLADWIFGGLDASMPLGWYFSDPGAKFNSSQVEDAMDSRVGSVLLFPVYDATQGNGSNLQYHIVGWAGFFMTGLEAQGNNATISGYLKHVAWEGRPSTSATNYFGAVVVKLTG